MLEAIREHAQGKAAKVILVLITLPFALWGIESYIQNGGDGPLAAKVGDEKITQQEFVQAIKEQQDRMRAALGKNYDPAVMDRPEARKSILDGLISQRIVLADAAGEGISVPDAQLARMIGGIEAFHENGHFSQTRYEMLLRQQNMTPAMFEHRLRQDLVLQAVQAGVARPALIPASVMDDLVRASEQKREASQAIVSIERFMSGVKVDPAALQAYYDKNLDEFRVPEQIRLEYVVLSPERLLPQVSVSEEEITAYYKENASRFAQAEERQASHILIKLDANASAADKAATLERARKLSQEARQNPAGFAALAKANSQDPGSATQGGDLGYFARGAMVKPFEDAVFKMAAGDISDPVQSDFGYHVIKLTAIKPGKARAQQEVAGEIATELKRQKAGKKFTESAENFGNIVYEQGDSLKPAAEPLALKVEQSQWISRKASDTPLLNHPKLLEAVFSEDVLKNRRNTEAIEVAPNTLVAARLLEYKPASVKPFAEVSSVLAQRLQRKEASALAVKQGRADLALLQQGKEPAGLSWSQPQAVSRSAPAGLDAAAVKEVFRLGTGKLPAYAGVENAQGGYTLVRVSRLIEADAPDAAKRQAYAQRFSSMLEQEYANAYLASLKQKTKIEIKPEALEKGER